MEFCEMNHDKSREPDLAKRTSALSRKAQQEPAEPLLLPAPDPASCREPLYEEQDIDGYTIAEARAALEAFKRRRQQA